MARVAAWAIVGVVGVALSSGCGDSPPKAASSAADRAPAACAPPGEDAQVTVTVDDIVGGYGALRVESHQPRAGVVQIAVEGKAGNAGPVSVVIHRETADGPEVGRLSGVAPGQACAVSFDLAAGTYVATADTNPGQKAKFEVR